MPETLWPEASDAAGQYLIHPAPKRREAFRRNGSKSTINNSHPSCTASDRRWANNSKSKEPAISRPRRTTRIDRLPAQEEQEEEAMAALCGSLAIRRSSTASLRISSNNSSRRRITALSSHAWSRDARPAFPRPIWPPTKGKWSLAVFIRTRVNHRHALRHRKSRRRRVIKTITKPNTKNPSGAD